MFFNFNNKVIKIIKIKIVKKKVRIWFFFLGSLKVNFWDSEIINNVFSVSVLEGFIVCLVSISDIKVFREMGVKYEYLLVLKGKKNI